MKKIVVIALFLGVAFSALAAFAEVNRPSSIKKSRDGKRPGFAKERDDETKTTF